MPLTHDFKETIRARAQTDSKFRQALLREAVESYLNGDLDAGKAVLRDYVNATVGFQALEERSPKQVMRCTDSLSRVNFRPLSRSVCPYRALISDDGPLLGCDDCLNWCPTRCRRIGTPQLLPPVIGDLLDQADAHRHTFRQGSRF